MMEFFEEMMESSINLESFSKFWLKRMVLAKDKREKVMEVVAIDSYVDEGLILLVIQPSKWNLENQHTGFAFNGWGWSFLSFFIYLFILIN